MGEGTGDRVGGGNVQAEMCGNGISRRGTERSDGVFDDDFDDLMMI